MWHMSSDLKYVLSDGVHGLESKVGEVWPLRFSERLTLRLLPLDIWNMH